MEKKIIAAIILIAILTCAGIALASYVMSSDPAQTVVSAQYDLVLAVPAQATQYENVTLVVTCTDPTFVGVVSFFESGSLIGSNSSVAGVARFSYNVTQARTYIWLAQGTHA